MHLFGRLTLASSIILALAVPAMAGVTVNSPAKGSTVSAPFKLSASSAWCGGRHTVTMGYSFDSSSDTTVFRKQSIDKSISVSAGTHTLHVKSWGKKTSCVKDVVIHVQKGAAAQAAMVPASSDSVSDIEVLGGWKSTHDTGGPGKSSGYMKIASSPSKFGNSRQFVAHFSNAGDERFSVPFSDNVQAEHFFYDGWIYLTSSAKYLANIELDVNQVMPSGKTLLAGIQCDGYSHKWAYNVNLGSAKNPRPHWASRSGTSCNPRDWKRNKWHHVQFSFSRNSTGHVTYRSVWFDGREQKLNVTAFAAASLGWGPVVTTQFQLDGLGSSGHVTAYLDHLSIAMW